MAEIFDRLIIRILLALFVCVVILGYRYAHLLFYPSVRGQISKKFNPSENPADTLHLFSRIVGLTIIFSSLTFNETHGVSLSLLNFFVWGSLSSILYLLSVYITESVLLHNFDYQDEVLKKKNVGFSIVGFSHSLVLAYLTRTLIIESENSLIIMIVLWLYMQVIFGFSIKYYHFLSKVSFQRMMIQKSVGGAISYAGFALGAGLVITGCFDQEHYDLIIYCIQVLLKVVLSLIIYPLFKRAISKIFSVQVVLDQATEYGEQQSLGYGIYEGCLFLASAILTSLIVNQIQFGTIYPFF